MDQETVEEDPNFHGYDSSGSYVPEGDGRAQLRTRKYYRDRGLQFNPPELPHSSGLSAQRPRAWTDPLVSVPEEQALVAEPSFEWDGFGEETLISEEPSLNNTRKWSADTQFNVPSANPTSGEEESTDSEGFQSTTGGDQDDDEDDSGSGAAEDSDAGSVISIAMDAVAWRRKAQRAVLEANEDVLPFAGKKLTFDSLQRLCALAASLKKDLQAAQVELQDDQAYIDNVSTEAAAARAALTAFLVDAEACKLEHEDEAQARRSEASLQAATATVASAEAKRPLILRRAAAAADELAAVRAAFQDLMNDSPKTDQQLYEKAEKVKVTDERYVAATADAKELAKLALESNLIVESGDLEEQMAASRKAKMASTDQLLEWRKLAGVWTEKKRRSDRGDVKLPSFTAGINSKTTVYEFEKEWAEYCSVMEYSKEEAVKVLKQAVQQPTRSDVINLPTVESIFEYLKKHHGNPMMLLNAKEQEVRSWTSCRGTDMEQREWLVQAKSKLETIRTMCRDHRIEKYLHFSTVAGEIQAKLPPDLMKDFKTVLKKQLSPSGILEKEIIIDLLLEFMDDKILECTLGVNLDIVNYLGATNSDKSVYDNQKYHKDGKNRYSSRGGMHAANQQHGGGRGRNGGGGNGGGGNAAYQIDDKCLGCGGNHSHLFYCDAYINSDLQTRFDLVKKQQACARCLGMKVKLVGKRDDWHPRHEKYCKTKFACKEDKCNGKPMKSQFHLTLCRNHPVENKKREADFVSSLDPALLPANCQSGVQFLHMGMWAAYYTGGSGEVETTTRGGTVYEVHPDVPDAAVFMMQTLPAAKGAQPLLAFYDSGCGSAGISDRAYHVLETECVRKGPTILDVAGGRCVEIPYGDERFTLELDGGHQLATITALRMPCITTPFPLVQLQEAWNDLAAAAGSQQLPRADKCIGGGAVDVIIGIKYLKYFPVLVFSLPSGLAIYRARFNSHSSNQAVLGGPHAAWSAAASTAGHMNPRAYLSSEARAWCVQESWVRINQEKFNHLEEEVDPDYCIYKLAIDCKEKSVKTAEREFWQTEGVGADSPYRCESCRCCQKCKNAEVLEEMSFREEAEQAQIESSVELDVENKRLVAKLPFIENPATALKPNRFVAESVLRSQLALFRKKPEMREDTVRSHDKLVTRGYVKADHELTKEERAAIAATPGDGYFIPWRIVHNEGSLSTPCRMVFDASSKTPGGNSLNGVLAKGKNRLVKIQNLLARFRQRSAAVTADISMAYNGTWLSADHIKYQKYLWKEGMEELKPTTIMYVLTLIYGVKPSGGQCQVSIEKLATHFKSRGLREAAADVLEKDVYVDDIISSQDSVQDCYEVAIGIEEVLAAGGLHVKAFTFSGQKPAEAVSADGIHVGLAGYLWRPEDDLLLLDIGPPRLGKAKRGKLPEPVVGDFGAALQKCFTRRTLTGVTARVFDPLGLATPVTAGLKLDLHNLCTRKLDWDDPVPLELLETWAANMVAVQDLKDVVFKRAIIPVDAATSTVDLLVAVDASQYLAAAAIYGRVLRKCGSYSCQLIMARSKITASLTIPRAELKSAVIGAVSSQIIKKNLGSSLGEVIYITDSTICLHWINQDDRPLQTAVRNAVIEVRRFSEVHDWLHVEGANNIADLATRKATVEDLAFGSAWQDGHGWMRRPRAEMPLKTAAEVVLTAEEKRAAAAETRSKDVHGHSIMLAVDQMAARYAHSRYVIDPCRFSWSKVIRILALVLRFICVLKRRRAARKYEDSCAATGPVDRPEPEPECVLNESAKSVITGEELAEAERYFFLKATEEVKRFSKVKEYKNCSLEKDGILYFSGRILDGQEPLALESVMFDLNPLSFCQPIVDRFSPIAYSIMIQVHWSVVNHLNATCTFRESLSQAYIIGGRELAQEVRKSCVFCRRFKAKLLDAEMGKIHDTRLSIAPPFTVCQVDLLGPYSAQCEHNHRATVKVWGVIFKDPASGAVFVHAMSRCDTSAFVQAYTRFAARFCHPQKLYPDEGSQLIHACKEMELSWIDVAHTLNAEHGVGVEFHPCPVGGHNVHGVVERSVQEVKKLFNTVYRGVKLDLLGFETAFGWISNELNNLPICIGSRYRDLDHLDLLTPNRLIHGRSNKRALSGCCMIGSPSSMLARMEEVFQAWWKAWHDEKVADFIAKPVKWLKSDRPLQVGDVVIFLKTGEEQVLGEPIWRIGRILEVEESERDFQVRTVLIEYKNAQEMKSRTTRRSVRKVAVLHREDEMEMVQELNAAARAAERLVNGQFAYCDQQEAVFRDVRKCKVCQAPYLCERHSGYFLRRPYVSVYENPIHVGIVQTSVESCGSELCSTLRIHTDPWNC